MEGIGSADKTKMKGAEQSSTREEGGNRENTRKENTFETKQRREQGGAIRVYSIPVYY